MRLTRHFSCLQGKTGINGRYLLLPVELGNSYKCVQETINKNGLVLHFVCLGGRINTISCW